jgi:hypothetical protein
VRPGGGSGKINTSAGRTRGHLQKKTTNTLGHCERSVAISLKSAFSFIISLQHSNTHEKIIVYFYHHEKSFKNPFYIYYYLFFLPEKT